jgi:putative ABC transport system permease protein
MIGTGIVLGALGGVALGELMSQFLYDIRPTDPVTYGAVVMVLGLTGLAACSIPAWHAAHTQPVLALRTD